jgi:superfamily II DNA/RNA helicase
MRTKQGCSRLTRELQRAGINADAIHGDKSQLERIKALEAFKGGTTHALIATDVAARGLDIDDLPYVINYELPHTPEDYVHRIGRTGRAGKMGNAISLVSAREVGYLVDIEKLIKRPIEQVEVAGFEPEPEYEYPPGNKRRRAAPPPVKAPVAQRPERPERQRTFQPPRGSAANATERPPAPQPDDRRRRFRLQQALRRNSPRGEACPIRRKHAGQGRPAQAEARRRRPPRRSRQAQVACAAQITKHGALAAPFFPAIAALPQFAPRQRKRAHESGQATRLSASGFGGATAGLASFSLMITSDRLSPPPAARARAASISISRSLRAEFSATMAAQSPHHRNRPTGRPNRSRNCRRRSGRGLRRNRISDLPCRPAR